MVRDDQQFAHEFNGSIVASYDFYKAAER